MLLVTVLILFVVLIYFLGSSFIVSAAFTMSKYMYMMNPQLTTSLLLWYGAITSTLIQTAWLGFGLRFYMIDSVKRANVVPVAIRTF